MSSETSVSVTMLSGNPFSDSFVIDTEGQPHRSTALQKPTIQVPILDPLPHLTVWSPQPSISTLSTTPSPTHSTFDVPITWNNADLRAYPRHLHSPILTPKQCTS